MKRNPTRTLTAGFLALAMLASLLPTALAASDETGTATGSLLASETYENSNGYTSSTTYTYDSDGNLLTETIETSDGETHTYTYTYDADGNLSVYVYASSSGYTYTYTYDTAGNTLTETLELSGNFAHSYTYTYDANGNTLTGEYRNGDGNTWVNSYTYTFDSAGRVLTQEIKNESNGITYSYSYSYDDAGNLLTSTYESSSGYIETYVYTYDDAGNMLTETYGCDGSTWWTRTYTYDDAGNVMAEELNLGNYTTTYTYTYDAVGNVLAEVCESDSTTETCTHTYTYDVLGNVLTEVCEDGSTTETYTYTYIYTYDGAFDDVSVETTGNSWYYDAVYWAYSLGITEGYTDGTTRTFKPSNNCTRAEFTTFLYQLANAYGLENAGETTSTSFTDVAEGSWYYTYVMWAAENGLVSGYEDGTFQPNKQITRAEAVTMLYGFYKSFVNGGQEPTVSDETSGFSDLSEDSWFYTYMLWATQNGVVSGYDDGTCRPNTNCTRSVMVVLLYATANHLL